MVNKKLEKYIETLKGDGVVVYPTETLVGLGASAVSKVAVEKVYELKERDSAKPMSILVRDMTMAEVYADTSQAKEVMEIFLPGGMTFILPGKKKTAVESSGTIGVRISSHPFTKELFCHIDFPITTTSVNKSGGLSAISRADLEWLPQHIDIAEYDESSVAGVQSSVVKVQGKVIYVKRVGIYSQQDILEKVKGHGYEVVLELDVK